MMGGIDEDTSIGKSSASQTRQSVNQISDIDEKNLQQMIMAIDFVSSSSFYLPDPLEIQNGSQNSTVDTVYMLSIEKINGLRTFLWTNASALEVPRAISDIAEAIENAGLDS